MMKVAKQLRTAVSMVNPDEVRRRAERPVSVGLVAADANGYAEMFEFLIPASASAERRAELMRSIHCANDPASPARCDVVFSEQGVAAAPGAFVFYRHAPEATVEAVLDANPDLDLALARRFPIFRKTVVERIVHAVSRENAFFVVATALPNVVPSLLELPWALGELASDTTFLTVNQVRMAFLVAAACGRPVGLSHQKAEILAIAAGAFGWRAIARELAGKIPFGGGLIPKGAIAYAGTFVVGKGLERFNPTGPGQTRAERAELYRQAYERGKIVTRSLTQSAGPASGNFE